MAYLLLSWFTWWDEKAIWEVKIFPYKEKFKNKTFQIQGEVNPRGGQFGKLYCFFCAKNINNLLHWKLFHFLWDSWLRSLIKTFELNLKSPKLQPFKKIINQVSQFEYMSDTSNIGLICEYLYDIKYLTSNTCNFNM